MRLSSKLVLAGASILLLAGCKPAAPTSQNNSSSSSSSVAKVFCGGIAALACPSGYDCVDNPDDSCDPAKGGADCGGICVTASVK